MGFTYIHYRLYKFMLFCCYFLLFLSSSIPFSWNFRWQPSPKHAYVYLYNINQSQYYCMYIYSTTLDEGTQESFSSVFTFFLSQPPFSPSQLYDSLSQSSVFPFVAFCSSHGVAFVLRIWLFTVSFSRGINLHFTRIRASTYIYFL